MRDYLLGVLSAVVASVALAWKQSALRYHEVTGEAREKPKPCEVPLPPSPAKVNHPFGIAIKNHWGPNWPDSPPTVADYHAMMAKMQQVAAQPVAQPTMPAFLFQPNVTLADALKAAYERGRVDGANVGHFEATKANLTDWLKAERDKALLIKTAYEKGRAAAYQAACNPSLN